LKSISDAFPSELGWIVQSTNEFGVNVTYASRPILTYSNTNTVTVDETIELPNNQAYTFILLDQGNNGMCCDLGRLEGFIRAHLLLQLQQSMCRQTVPCCKVMPQYLLSLQ
jgi:hypothetical protein